MGDLARTQLYDLHVSQGAKMVPFAGYEMPVQYALGVMKEHLWTRSHAGLFDVSHMGQVRIVPRSEDLTEAAHAFERLVPQDILGLAEGRQRYGFFTNASGGIEDDLMIANRGDHLFVVVNAACKANDLALMEAGLSDSCDVTLIEDRALLALQGPEAEAALKRLLPVVADTRFMDVLTCYWQGAEVWVSRSGYTGEDGFEVSVPEAEAIRFAEALLAMDEVEAIGLGARDSLRLEAGLCLYGADIDATTSPVEADLSWAIQKARRSGGARAGGFPGADRILDELENGASRKRVGLLPEGRAPMRAETEIFDGENRVGQVTSGAFGPSLERPMSMGYVSMDYAENGTLLTGEVRGKRLPLKIVDLPFLAARFKR